MLLDLLVLPSSVFISSILQFIVLKQRLSLQNVLVYLNSHQEGFTCLLSDTLIPSVCYLTDLYV